MPRTGSARMSPQDDELARLLIDMGFSLRRTAAFLGTTDKTIKAAVERAGSKGVSPFPVGQQKQLERLLDFRRWVNEGESKGYLPSLVSYLGQIR